MTAHTAPSPNRSCDPATVVIADDHPLMRSALRAIFEAMDGVAIVGEAGDGVEAIALAKTLQPRLITLDSGMPLAGGMEAFGEIRRWSPNTLAAVVTGFTSAGHLADWVAAGVEGVFLKTCPPEEMAHGLSLILADGRYISKAVMASLEAGPERVELTMRERQILHLIAQGRANAEIADRLSISAKTVDNHRTRLMAKLGVRSVAQLLAFALKEGLLDQSTQI